METPVVVRVVVCGPEAQPVLGLLLLLLSEAVELSLFDGRAKAGTVAVVAATAAAAAA